MFILSVKVCHVNSKPSAQSHRIGRSEDWDGREKSASCDKLL